MRLIDADALLRILEREQDHIKDIPTRVDGLMDAIMDVLSAPTVDAVPSAQPDWNEMIVVCDCCGHTIHVKRQYGGDGNG